MKPCLLYDESNDMISSWIKPHIAYLTSNTLFGLCQEKCYLEDCRSGSSLSRKSSKIFDRFTLSLPHAAERIKWEVIFNESEPFHPPDFIFDSPSFEPNIDKLPSLVSWDGQDPRALANVMHELYRQYQGHQIKALSKYPELSNNYLSLVTITNANAVEVFIQPADKKVQNSSTTVIFLVNLEIPVWKIPKHVLPNAEEEDPVLVRVMYKMNENPSTPKESISMSVALQQVLGDVTKLPPLTKDYNFVLYIKELREHLTSKINALDDMSLNKRKAYMEALVNEFKSGIVEYDNLDFSKATVLISFLDFNVFLCVTMPTGFPEQQPRLLFRSAYHVDVYGQPYCSGPPDYPWSPRWSATEMVQRLKQHLPSIIPKFQQMSLSSAISALQAVTATPSAYANYAE